MGFLKVLDGIFDSLESLLSYSIDIPFLTAFYKEFSGDEKFTILNGVCLLFAVPVTGFYKSIKNGAAPFAKTSYGLDTDNAVAIIRGQNVPALSDDNTNKTMLKDTLNFEKRIYKKNNECSEAQIIYSQVGGLANILFDTASTIISGIELESEDTIPVLPKIELLLESLSLLSSFPVGNGEALNLQKAVWLTNLCSLGINVVALNLGPLFAPLKGGIDVVIAGLKLYFYIFTFKTQLETEMEEDIEKMVDSLCFASNVLDSTSIGIRGAAELDFDPETRTFIIGLSMLASSIKIIINGSRLVIVIMEDIKQEYHVF